MAAGAPRVGVFHPGSQHSLQTAIAFQETGQLAWHATTVYYDSARWPYRIERFLPVSWAARLGREFRRRYDPALDPAKVRTFGCDEWAEIALRRLKWRALADRVNRVGNRRFGRRVAALIEREPVDAVWGFNTSACDVFRWAKARGVRCVLDQTIGHPRAMNRMFEDEYRVHPDYFVGPAAPFDEAAIALQDEEVALADVVVCGSEFCAETMRDNGCPPEKLRIVPYGYSDWLFPDEKPVRAPLAGRPVKFLFAGTVEPRKGVPYVLEAFARIPAADATLTLIGRLDIPASALARFAGRVTHIGQIPRGELIAHYRDADCFIFPSLFEGGGLVLYEAAAAGLGIIQSRFCGDGVRAGRNGVSLERVDATTVLDAVRRVVADRDMLARWQDASWVMRRERSWSIYRKAIREIAAP